MMEKEILKELGEIEDKFNITILYAVECGSRIYGYSNENSDYDIKFIYQSNPLQYLKLTIQKDTIHLSAEKFDLEGWDVKKALYLHYKSNPSLYEWLLSDKIYIHMKKDIFCDLPSYNKFPMIKHYEHMALSTLNTINNSSDSTLKKIKKLIVVCRCCLMKLVLINNIEIKSLNMEYLLDVLTKPFHQKIHTCHANNIFQLIKAYQSANPSLISIEKENEILAWCKSIIIMRDYNRDITRPDIEKYDARFQELFFDSCFYFK